MKHTQEVDINLFIQLYLDSQKAFLRIWKRCNRKGAWYDVPIRSAVIPFSMKSKLNESERVQLINLLKSHYAN